MSYAEYLRNQGNIDILLCKLKCYEEKISNYKLYILEQDKNINEMRKIVKKIFQENSAKNKICVNNINELCRNWQE
jgi:hypothetical protein